MCLLLPTAAYPRKKLKISMERFCISPPDATPSSRLGDHHFQRALTTADSSHTINSLRSSVPPGQPSWRKFAQLILRQCYRLTDCYIGFCETVAATLSERLQKMYGLQKASCRSPIFLKIFISPPVSINFALMFSFSL